MPSKSKEFQHRSLGAWAKQCYFAGRAVMDAALRPYDLGATQWYVLYHLTQNGPTMQRDLLRLMQVERATLSVVVSALVRKGLIDQQIDSVDRRQKLLRLTKAGRTLWRELPDLAFINTIAFDGFEKTEIEATLRVLQIATKRLEEYSQGGTNR